jgi:putative intracellular protease/amidase
MTSIDVLVFDGCEALDAHGPYEVLAYGGLDVRAVTRTERRLEHSDAKLIAVGDGKQLPSIGPGGMCHPACLSFCVEQGTATMEAKP